MPFLKEYPLRPWQLPQAGDLRPIGLALGPGPGGLEVAVAESQKAPTLSVLRSAWKSRQSGRPAPVLLVVLHNGKAALCGPVGDQPPAFLDLTPGRVESICATKRESAGHHYSTEVNEFLVRLNQCSEKGILVIGATNFAGKLDEAVLRPGRFDYQYYVPPPDFGGRMELSKEQLKGRPCGRIDWNYIAGASDGRTCADVMQIMNQAARFALREQAPIETRHFMEAIKEMPPPTEGDKSQIGFRP